MNRSSDTPSMLGRDPFGYQISNSSAALGENFKTGSKYAQHRFNDISNIGTFTQQNIETNTYEYENSKTVPNQSEQTEN